jgi:hypothetical protein
MTKLLEEAMAQLQTLPEDEQDRAAEVLLAFAHDRRDYTRCGTDRRHPARDGTSGQRRICKRQATAKDFRPRTMNIRVTEDAADDLENIKERIARDDGAAAERIVTDPCHDTNARGAVTSRA